MLLMLSDDVQAFMNNVYQLCIWINLFLSFKEFSGLSCNWAKTAIQLVGSAYLGFGTSNWSCYTPSKSSANNC